MLHPLLSYSRGGLAELLPKLFTEITVPGGVFEEIIAGGTSDSAATALLGTSWINRVEMDAIASEILIWNLGTGESEVLSLALADKSYVAMIDDRAARKCARTWAFKPSALAERWYWPNVAA